MKYTNILNKLGNIAWKALNLIIILIFLAVFGALMYLSFWLQTLILAVLMMPLMIVALGVVLNHQLEILATKTAKEVAKTKVEVKLKPMNSYERRVIHEKLSDWRDVYTESEGEGENRAIIIKPKNN